MDTRFFNRSAYRSMNSADASAKAKVMTAENASAGQRSVNRVALSC
jgi:hypothetical protein